MNGGSGGGAFAEGTSVGPAETGVHPLEMSPRSSYSTLVRILPGMAGRY